MNEPQIITRNGWINGHNAQVAYDPDKTLSDYARETIPPHLLEFVFAQRNGEPFLNWHEYKPTEGEHVLLYVMPQGGDDKNPLLSLVAIGLSVFAPTLAPSLAFGGSAIVGNALYAIGSSLILSALQKALIKPPEQQSSISYDAPGKSPYLSFTGIQNRSEPWGNVPRVYGRMRVYPKLIAQPKQVTGQDGANWFYLAFDFGYGPLQLSNFKLGENKLELYNDYYQNIHYNFDSNSRLEFFQAENTSYSVGLQLLEKPNQNEVIATTAPNTERSLITLAFPSGLFFTSEVSGGQFSDFALVSISARPVGSMDWQPINELGLVDKTEIDPPIDYPDLPNYEDLFGPRNLLKLQTWFADGVYKVGIQAGTTSIEIHVNSGLVFSFLTIGDELWIYDNSNKIPRLTFETITNLIDNGWDIFLGGSYDIILTWSGVEVVFDTFTTAAQVPLNASVAVNTQQKTQLDPAAPDAWWGNANYYQINTPLLRTTEPFSVDFNVEWFTPGQYEILVLNQTESEKKYPTNDMYWTTLLSYVITDDTKIFSPVVPHTVVELKIRATNQLNGMIDNYNAIAESFLPVWDSVNGWINPVYNDITGLWNIPPTRNPAWIYLDILRGTANKRPVADHLLELDDFKAWAIANDTPAENDLNAPAFQCDLIIDGDTTVKETLATVASCGRAAPARKDSKFSIIRDDENRLPVQLITPKNTSGFTSNITYIRLPHALKISFLDSETGYAATEAIVYNDGYSEKGGAGTVAATVFESLNLPGTTRYNQAIRLGRFYLATAKLQRERVTCSMDYENLICQRGDLVLCSNEILIAAGLPRRITKVEANASGPILTLDESVSGATTARLREDMQLYSITHLGANIIQLPNTAPLPVVGDLIEYGATTTNRIPYTVEQVTPGSGLSAQLTLVEYTKDIDESIIGPIDPPPTTNALSAVRNLTAQQNHYVENGFRMVRIDLRWTVPASGFASYYNVYRYLNGLPYYVGRTTTTSFNGVDTVNVSKLQTSQNRVYMVEPVLDRVGAGPRANVVTTILPDRTPPPDVEGFSINAQSEQLILMWDRVVVPDIARYEIRYSYDEGASWAQAMKVSDSIPGSANTLTVPMRPGRYYIKAIDTAGNYSVNAASAVVQVGDVTEVVNNTTIVFTPFDTGTYDDTTITGVSGGLELVSGVYTGYYYPPSGEALSFPALTKSRLYAALNMIAVAPPEVLSGPWFDPLATAIPLTPNQIGRDLVDGQIEFRYRTTSGGTWSNWERLLMADVSAVDIEFRIKLTTTNLDYKPSVSAASVRVDWLARTEFGNNVAVSTAGLYIAFQHKFAANPAINVTFIDAAIGDDALITSKTNEGFFLQLYNRNNNVISGVVDWVAYGYGMENI